ncbi:Glucose-responsive transcription factor [Neurospora sp. IMI 360204]|nr:Glucose-responsive transcription factor [Neurospora sp. IMI 360204]
MDEKKPNPGDDEVMTGISHPYPSPSVETTDAQFYHISAQREGELEHQSDGPDQPDGLPTVTDHHENHHLHELQELQDPVSPNQHARSGPSLSNEDLQLAAQLTQDLAPVIAAAAASHNQAQEEQLQVQIDVPVQTEDVDMQNDAGDPDLQEQLQVQLQNHNHELQSVMQSHAEQQQQEQQDQNRQQQEQQQQQQSPQQQQQPSTTSQQQPQQQQQQPQVPVQTHPHYVQQVSQMQQTPGPTAAHLSTHIPIDHLAGAHPQYGAAVQDNTPPRKRSKVSRACDECRRKKIKCDAQSEVSDQPCSNCRRSSAPCLFSRVPQKRGPSKGYIKELADRINTIEGKLTGAAVPDPLDRRRTTPAEAFGSPIPGDDGRKRPYSSISSETFTPPAHERLAGWGSEANRAPEHRPIRPYHPTYPQIHSVNDLVPKPLAMSQSPDVNGVQAHASEATADAASQDGLASNGLSQEPLEQAREISDVAFECYLNSVHRIFPILASKKDRVHSMLSQCPPVLQEAFYHALFAMLNPMLPESAGRENCNSLTSHGLLNEWDSQPRTMSSPVADLVCLQTLIMLIIEADYGGISAVKGQRGGPKKLSLLGEAVGLGYIMKLHLASPPDVNPNMDLDPDSEKNIALRAWWTLVALDRWNAFIPLFLTLSAPTPSDFAALTTKKPLVASLLNALMESFRWQFPADLITSPSSDPTLLLAYWHVRLLVDLCSGGTKADFALQDCANIVGILTGNPELLTPLNHHFISLVSLALLELEKLERTRDDAGRLLKDLLDFRVAASPWTGVVRDKIMSASLVNRERSSTAVVNGNHNSNAASSQSQVQSHLQAALQSQSLSQPLQQLADLATVAAGVEQSANDASAENMVSSAAAVAAAAAAVAAAAAAHHQQQSAALSSVNPASQVMPTSLDPEGNAGQGRGETRADRDVDMDMGVAAPGSNEERHTNGAEHAEPEQQQHFKTEYRSDEEHEFKTEPQPETRPDDQSRQQAEQQEPQHVLSASPVDENGIAGPGQTETTSAQEPESQQPAPEAPARETASSAAPVVVTPNGSSTTTDSQNANKEDLTPNGTSTSQASLTASLALSLGSGFGSLGLNTAEIYEHYQRQQQELQLQKQAQQAVQQATQQSQSQSQPPQNPPQDQQQQQQHPYHHQRFESKEASSQHHPHQPQQIQAQLQPAQQPSLPLSQAQAQAQLQQVVAKQQQLVLQTLQQHQQQSQQQQQKLSSRPYEPEVFLKAGYLTCFGDADDPVVAVASDSSGAAGSGNSNNGGNGVGSSGNANGNGNGVVGGNGNGTTSK